MQRKENDPEDQNLKPEEMDNQIDNIEERRRSTKADPALIKKATNKFLKKEKQRQMSSVKDIYLNVDMEPLSKGRKFIESNNLD
jgi:hypothetical protein